MSPPGSVASVSLRPLAWAYGAAVRLRNAWYDRGRSVRCADAPVVSVGNLTLGGTGKTPLVAWIARELEARGSLPAIVSRGYGGQAGRGPLVVSSGTGPTCPASVCGDEPWLLARSVERLIVVVGADRFAAAVEALRAGATAIVLDDGFQHRALARDLDLVTLDARDPFGGGRLLPAGRLREPPAALARADAVLVTRPTAERRREIEREVRRHNPRAPVLAAAHRRVGFFDRVGAPHAPPARAVAFCGIASPDRFREDLLEAGIELAAFVAFRDHRRFDPRDRRDLVERARRASAALVTTEKDLARLGDAASELDLPLLVLRIAAVPEEPAALGRLLGAALDRARARARS